MVLHIDYCEMQPHFLLKGGIYMLLLIIFDYRSLGCNGPVIKT